MSVRPEILARCKAIVDGRIKSTARKALNYYIATRWRLAEVGEGFQSSIVTRIPPGSRIGSFAYIGKNFYSAGPISLGDLAMISTSVTIVGNDHGFDDEQTPMRLAFRWMQNITIFEADVWVGHGAVIKAGITVGKGSVIAAGAIVTKNVEPYSIVAGNPARVIKRRFSDSATERYDRTLYEERLVPSQERA
ncbi:DapH/DapD/GlmU-related protein [Neorhizobium sp. CSC1952]|uniref:acyltransferase n=1 Tax=Neorhizobium sp. CSC1952 TaxID=2978974 RepID=UPI0025A6214C|nr:DapH/DapD/GlmU-related protein [Rhizobium sp. CSC1952]WJR67332.1 DapH/DapD/GlmU-related protein [Rhizobium sp. CSC1952]